MIIPINHIQEKALLWSLFFLLGTIQFIFLFNTTEKFNINPVYLRLRIITLKNYTYEKKLPIFTTVNSSV